LSVVEYSQHDQFKSEYLSYSDFKREFAYKGESLYSLIFNRNKDKIRISKEKFAVKNLRKIIDATFHLSSKIGFQAMSLRDLSTETGLSMGGLYSSISSKETIAIMVKDVVALVCENIVEESRQQQDPAIALEILVRGYLYASTLMHHWFYFLYFETRSLPPVDQEQSKNIELTQVEELEKRINQLVLKKAKLGGGGESKDGVDVCHKSEFVATMALSLIQERYLKPWKYHQAEKTIDDYADNCLRLIYRAVCVEEDTSCSTG